MPKLEPIKCEMTASLTLTEHEVGMLNYLSSFGGRCIANAICEGLGSEYTTKEWDDFWATLRAHLALVEKRFEDTRAVFNSRATAVRNS